MAAESKRPFAHLTLVEVLIGVALLAVAGVFLVRNMQQAKEREQTKQLVEAMSSDDAATVKALIEGNPDLCNAKGERDRTPLHWAALNGNDELAELLLAKEADHAATDMDGMTPLHWAAWKGHKEMTELLLAKGSDPNATETSGQTPLHIAATFGHKELAELLLAKGADLNAKDNGSTTPLDRAKMSKRKALIDLLRARGAKE